MDEWFQKHKHALIGFPEDRGVQRNNGRPGAAEGPSAIRKVLHDSAGAFRETPLYDLGDIEPHDSLDQRQKILGSTVRFCLEKNVFPIVLGGGHETAYGHFQGYSGDLNILNIDAHTDVRPLVDGHGNSGTPFRQILELAKVRNQKVRLIEFGLQQSCNSDALVQYALENRVELHWLSTIRKHGIETSLQTVIDSIKSGPVYLTIDLDALAASEFPATSAAPKEGLTFQELESIVAAVSKMENLKSLDFCEFNPKFDTEGECAHKVVQLIEKFYMNFFVSEKKLSG